MHSLRKLWLTCSCSKEKKKDLIPAELLQLAKENKTDEESIRLQEKREAKKAKKKRMKVGRPGDWKCSCGAIVFASKNNCFKCGGSKFENERPMSSGVSFS